MAQANRVNTTTKRQFLTGAAGVAAAAIMSFPAGATARDPIFDAIRQHREAMEAFSTAIFIGSDLEGELPPAKRRSSIDHWEEKIVETDDPRWIANERATRKASKRADDAAMGLLDLQPTSMAGVLALLTHFAETDEENFPETDPTFGRALAAHVLQALRDISAVA